MKKLIFIALLMLSVMAVKAQSNDSIQVKAKFEYCEISGHEPFGGSLKISIDYGTFEEKTEYKSMIEAMDAMAVKGWELVSSHVSAKANGNNTTFYYVLRKKVE